MKIVFLDRETVGKDIDLSSISEQGELEIFELTAPDEVFLRIEKAEIVITNKVVLGEKEMSEAKNLKLICVAATGYNNIDISAAKKRNIVVANVKSYSTESVAQLVWASILNLQTSYLDFVQDIRLGKWQKSKTFAMLTHPIFEVFQKNLGILGFGTIGKRIAEIGKAFGMKIFVAKRESIPVSENILQVDFETLLRESDILTIHVPLTQQTHNLITINELRMMKPTAILINTARGGIVNESDLYFALKNKIIRSAAMDVLSQEPPRENIPLFELKNIFFTPHIAWTSQESRKRLIDGIAFNIRKFKNGEINEISIK